MLEVEWLTKHEAGVLKAALRSYHAQEARKATKSATAATRAQAGANRHVAAVMLQKLTTR